MTLVPEKVINLGPHQQYPKSVKAGIPKLSSMKPGWTKVPIGDLFDVVSRPVDMHNETVYNLVTVKRSRGGVIERSKLPGTKIAVKSQFYVETGDFLISKRQIVHGACGFVPAELSGSIVSNEYSVLQCSDILLPEFLSYLMHTPYFQQTCFHSSIGIHVEKLIFKLDEWFKWDIYLPSKDEQQKIVNGLNTVDDKLNKLRLKYKLLDSYKCGLMQNIFSKKIRFEQSNDSSFSDWEEIEFGKLFSERSEKNFEDNELLSVKMTGGVVRRSDIKGKNNSSDNKSNYKRVLPGDIAYNSMRMWQGASGLSLYEGIVSPAYTVITPNENSDPLFFSYLFKYPPLVFTFRRFSQGLTSDTWNLKYKAFSKIKWILPTDKEEQTKIASALQLIDHKLDGVSRVIDKFEAFKKGLLHKMFL
jgi:type I restriction enzyme S subunit